MTQSLHFNSWPRLIFISLSLARQLLASETLSPPIVINTWNFSAANKAAWIELSNHRSALDAIEKGCSQCEVDRCDGTVGWGGSPSESGETTLDAMIMDGETHDVGGVGGLRRVKNAISVARLVLERTEHSLLVGEMATKFATSLGFKEESLTSRESIDITKKWLANRCQPNYWKNVLPDPSTSCGPYKLIPLNSSQSFPSLEETFDNSGGENMIGPDYIMERQQSYISHDTIGMVALDSQNRIASGTSTNGLRHKILGRVGDSPVPGSGSYAIGGIGAAAATGDGDTIMRYLVSYQAVEFLRQGLSAKEAAQGAISRIIEGPIRLGLAKSQIEAAVVVLSSRGDFGAACVGLSSFHFVVSDLKQQVRVHEVSCLG